MQYKIEGELTSGFSVIYKTVNNLELPMRIYMPEEKKANGRTVINIHGGGWRGITKNEKWNGSYMKYQADYFSKLGFVGIEFSYRSIELENTKIFDIIDDCIDAMKYIKKLKYGNKEIIVCGDSAGGHLAIELAFAMDSSLRPQKVVACNPVVDCTCEKWSYIEKDIYKRRLISPMYNMQRTDTIFCDAWHQ